MSRSGVALAVLLAVVIVGAIGAYSVLAPQTSFPPPCPTGGTPSFSSSTIKIGLLTELSGSSDPNGYSARIAADLAVNQTNAAGGVDGKNISLVAYNSESDPTVAAKGASVLAQDGVLAITGPTYQPDALAIESYAERCGVPFVSSAVSSAVLTPPGLNWTVNVQPDSVQWGAAVAKYVSEAIPAAKIALMVQNTEQQKEMAAGVRWYADTYKNESIVFDQEYANAQFPWATAATAVKFSGANAVIISWLSAVGFSQSSVVQALQTAGFQQNQIFVVSADGQISDLGDSAAGIRGAALFDGGLAAGYPNATAFTNDMQPYVNGELNSSEYCGICPTDIGPVYYYSYLGMEMMINSIQNVLSGGQTLTRASFMSSMKHASIDDAFGNPVSIDSAGSSVGTFYIVQVGQLTGLETNYPLKILTTIRFAAGTVPSYKLATGS